MLKSLAVVFVIGSFLAPGAALAKDCMAWCQQVRCTPQNVGGSVGNCLSRCTAACNEKKK
jgi:hypothetical protein